MRTYKGFNKDMTCRGFKYEEGKEYETDKAVVCKTGFHACEHPLDCFRYYAPSKSVYCEVEQDGDIDRNSDNTKVASTKIKIGAKLDIAGIVKAAIEFTKEKVNEKLQNKGYKGVSSATGDYGASSATGYCGVSSATGDYGVSSATGDCGASSATGDYGASSATGDYGASSATGYCGVSSATGDCGASSATGDYGASSATGYCGVSSATGDYGASSATGYCGVSSATGYCGASSATGYCGASSAGSSDSVAIAWGYKGKAKGVIGSYLVLADWEGDEKQYWKKEVWTLKDAKIVYVDGKNIKEDTYYTMIDGKVIETE